MQLRAHARGRSYVRRESQGAVRRADAFRGGRGRATGGAEGAGRRGAGGGVGGALRARRAAVGAPAGTVHGAARPEGERRPAVHAAGPIRRASGRAAPRRGRRRAARARAARADGRRHLSGPAAGRPPVSRRSGARAGGAREGRRGRSALRRAGYRAGDAIYRFAARGVAARAGPPAPTALLCRWRAARAVTAAATEEGRPGKRPLVAATAGDFPAWRGRWRRRRQSPVGPARRMGGLATTPVAAR